jgi:hypothetical protein
VFVKPFAASTQFGSPAAVRWLAAGLAVLCLTGPGVVNAQRIVNPAISAKPHPNEGKRPVGWLVRSDSTAAGGKRDSVHLVYRGRGYHLESGPPSLVWTPKNVARGTFILESIMFSGRSGSTFPEGFGVFLGGRNMQTPQAQYTEFLVRNDGYYAVFQHVGPKVVKLKDWTQLAGINLHGGRRDESVRNSFRVIVDENTVQLVVNRTLATSFLRTTFQPDGEYGVRIGTKQLIQVETLGLEKLKK